MYLYNTCIMYIELYLWPSVNINMLYFLLVIIYYIIIIIMSLLVARFKGALKIKRYSVTERVGIKVWSVNFIGQRVISDTPQSHMNACIVLSIYIF